MSSVVVKNPLRNVRRFPKTFKRGAEYYGTHTAWKPNGRNYGQRNLFHPRLAASTINFTAQPVTVNNPTFGVAPVKKTFRWSNGNTNGYLAPTGMGLTYEPYDPKNPVSYNRRSVPQSKSSVIEQNKKSFLNFFRRSRKSRKSRRNNT
jgi:hypothetical protein